MRNVDPARQAASPPASDVSTQLAPGDLVSPESLGADRQRRAVEIAAGVDLSDSTALATFGAAPQRRLSGFLDQLLAGTRTDEIGVAGQLVAELAADIKRIDLPALKREAEGSVAALGRLPVVGRYFSAWRRFRALQAPLTVHLAEIEKRAEVHLGKLKAGNAALDRLLDATDDNLRDLEVYIAGGQLAAQRMRAEHAAMRDALAASRDAVRMAGLRDMAEQIEAFETRLVRMQVAFTRGILAIPQIRTAQQAGRIEIQNTLDTVLFDLPDLKSAIVRVAALERISRAADATAARRKITRELQQIGIDSLDRAYTTAKRSQGDVADDLASLTMVSQRMVGIIDRGMQIDRENRGKREAAVQQIGEVRARLLESLQEHADKSLLS